MNKKIKFSQSPSYLTKVKKENHSKSPKKGFAAESAQEKRHEKINFKQYLRNIRENDDTDEYADVSIIPLSHFKLDSLQLAENDNNVSMSLQTGLYTDTDGHDGFLYVKGVDLEELINLEKQESFSVVDHNSFNNNRWYLTRTINNDLVIECEIYDFSGKQNFDDVLELLVN